MSFHGHTANLPHEYQSPNSALITQPAGGWPEKGWVDARMGDDFWHDQKIAMPSNRHIPNISKPTLVTAAEPMCKVEPMESELPPVVKREPKWKRTGEDPKQRGSARPEPMESERTLQIIVEDLPQLPYQTARQSTSDSTPRRVYFRVEGATDDGFPLWRAFDNKFDGLVDGDKPSPFQSASAKVSIRLQFDRCESYARQIMARRSTASSEPISMKVLAHKIAHEMRECLWKTQVAGKPLLHRGRVVQLEDLYLWRITKVSPGSWVPEFKVMPWIFD